MLVWGNQLLDYIQGITTVYPSYPSPDAFSAPMGDPSSYSYLSTRVMSQEPSAVQDQFISILLKLLFLYLNSSSTSDCDIKAICSAAPCHIGVYAIVRWLCSLDPIEGANLTTALTCVNICTLTARSGSPCNADEGKRELGIVYNVVSSIILGLSSSLPTALQPSLCHGLRELSETGQARCDDLLMKFCWQGLRKCSCYNCDEMFSYLIHCILDMLSSPSDRSLKLALFFASNLRIFLENRCHVDNVKAANMLLPGLIMVFDAVRKQKTDLSKIEKLILCLIGIIKPLRELPEIGDLSRFTRLMMTVTALALPNVSSSDLFSQVVNLIDPVLFSQRGLFRFLLVILSQSTCDGPQLIDCIFSHLFSQNPIAQRICQHLICRHICFSPENVRSVRICQIQEMASKLFFTSTHALTSNQVRLCHLISSVLKTSKFPSEVAPFLCSLFQPVLCRSPKPPSYAHVYLLGILDLTFFSDTRMFEGFARNVFQFFLSVARNPRSSTTELLLGLRGVVTVVRCPILQEVNLVELPAVVMAMFACISVPVYSTKLLCSWIAAMSLLFKFMSDEQRSSAVEFLSHHRLNRMGLFTISSCLKVHFDHSLIELATRLSVSVTPCAPILLNALFSFKDSDPEQFRKLPKTKLIKAVETGCKEDALKLAIFIPQASTPAIPNTVKAAMDSLLGLLEFPIDDPSLRPRLESLRFVLSAGK